MQSINLIPEQEVQEQTKTKVVKLSTILTLVILVVVGALSGYFFYQTNRLKGELTSVNSQIDKLRSEISALAPVEISARNLDSKYRVLGEIFSSRGNYSLLADELRVRTPEGITIDSFTIQKGTKISISGDADNYILISSFMNNLLNNEYKDGNPTLRGLFTSVSLNSVNLEKSKNMVRFAIGVDINLDLIKK
ncbi:hypothetical protein A2619_05255 [candidate division WWE3 bacterium RIFOXYD1_FULL_39_9]|uniref:Uncharacterized protein n=1 Tax=candidate division WWE3 bacterium RIFOXYD1_FULL_39_9 TaxID=1802649 RepID=A0A1F4X904_UNCKA|nr:MAG: hypothetical protein A2619_05255 [candidate division WWE3 bacterium RIFOXYD1_FULL_39_9]